MGLCASSKKSDEKHRRAKDRRVGVYSAPVNKDEDPASVAEEFKRALSGMEIAAEIEEIFNAVDVDQSDSIAEAELTYYMDKAGPTKDQIRKLFASMDKGGNGYTSRVEFRQAIRNGENKALLTPQQGSVHESPVIIKEAL